jgi:hypothetical protein
MTTNKFEWISCMFFMAGVAIMVTGFKLASEVELSDVIATIALIFVHCGGQKAYLYHQQQLQPFINSLMRFDSNDGVLTFSIQNVGGGYAKINNAYYRFKHKEAGHVGNYPLTEMDEEFRIIQNLIT